MNTYAIIDGTKIVFFVSLLFNVISLGFSTISRDVAGRMIIVTGITVIVVT